LIKIQTCYLHSEDGHNLERFKKYPSPVFTDIGKVVVIAGLVTVGVGLLLIASEKAGLSNWFNWFGHLPLDFSLEKKNVRFSFPMGSSIVLSILLSMIFYLVNKFIR
jgi:hypothetical protein